MDILEIRGIFLFIIAFFNFILALILWSKTKKDNARLWLGFTALFSGFYAFFCGATYFFWESGDISSIYWYRLTWLGVFILPSFVIFTYFFTQKLKNLTLKALLLYIGAFVISYLALTSNLFVKVVYLKGPNISSLAGVLDPIGRIYIFFCLTIALINLFKEFSKASGFRKLQLNYFILGTTIFAIGGIVTTAVVPFIIKESPYYDIAAYLSFLWIGLTSYAVLKYHLMDIRVIMTELFVFGMWIVLVIRTLLSVTIQDWIINSILLIIMVFFGILLTRSVLREVEQRKQLEVLAKEIQKAYEVEKKARQELTKLDEAKNQFIMATQHHLRTPLTSMRGYLDLLLAGDYGKISLKVKDVLKKFEISSSRLVKVINEFLDISQFQLGREVVFLRPNIDIEPIFDEIMEELNFEAKSKGIYLKFKKPKKGFPKIKADLEKLKIALFNVVDNGIKYTNKGGLTIRIVTTDSKIRIEISDTGIGMERDEIKTLFTKLFERGEQAKRIFATGRGIGLFIAAQIIKAHHGEIWAESEGKGLGSTFYVELPMG